MSLILKSQANIYSSGTFSTVGKCGSVILGSGPGVLFLPGVVSILGWIAAPCVLILAAVVTWYTSLLLAYTYADDQPSEAKRQRSYKDAVSHHLGMSSSCVLPTAQHDEHFHIIHANIYIICREEVHAVLHHLTIY